MPDRREQNVQTATCSLLPNTHSCIHNVEEEEEGTDRQRGSVSTSQTSKLSGSGDPVLKGSEEL